MNLGISRNVGGNFEEKLENHGEILHAGYKSMGSIGLKQIACKAALNKHLVSADIQHLSYVQQTINTAMKWLISGVLSARNQQLQYSAAIRC